MSTLSVTDGLIVVQDTMEFLGYRSAEDYLVSFLIAALGLLVSCVRWPLLIRRAAYGIGSFFALIIIVTFVRLFLIPPVNEQMIPTPVNSEFNTSVSVEDRPKPSKANN